MLLNCKCHRDSCKKKAGLVIGDRNTVWLRFYPDPERPNDEPSIQMDANALVELIKDCRKHLDFMVGGIEPE